MRANQLPSNNGMVQDFAAFNARPDAKLWIFQTTKYPEEQENKVAYVFGYTWFEARSGALAALDAALDQIKGSEIERPSETIVEPGSTIVFIDKRGAFHIVENRRSLSGEEIRLFDPSLLTKSPKEAAVSMVERPDGKLLCVWNRRYSGWSLPGGMVEEGETPEDAQQRELKEETDLLTTNRTKVFEGEHGLPAQEERANCVHVFQVTASGLAKEMEIGCPITWLTPEEFIATSPFGYFYKQVFETTGKILNSSTLQVIYGDNEQSSNSLIEPITKTQTNGVYLSESLVQIQPWKNSDVEYEMIVAGHATDKIYDTRKEAEQIAQDTRETIQKTYEPQLEAKYQQGRLENGEYLRACYDIKEAIHTISDTLYNGLSHSTFLDLLINSIKRLEKYEKEEKK